MKTTNQPTNVQTRTWQMSFNDLLTVLLTFFILMISVSNIHIEKVQVLSSSAVETFGSTADSDIHAELVKSLSDLQGIRVHPISGGISVVFPESLLYESGSAVIVHKGLLRKLSEKMKGVSGTIRIEGHTDNVPIVNGSFPSNWELSIQRAANVAKFITQECGIDPRNVSTVGYADSRPVASNDSVEGQALNRRVNIIISLK